jgi:hypothetical protein
MKFRCSIQAGVLIFSLFLFTNSVFGCKVLADLNTFKKADIGSVTALKCDGVWAILVNSDLSNSDWSGVYKTLGAGWNVSEANPGFQPIYINPQLVKQLQLAEGSVQTNYGTVTSNWKKTKFVREISLPANTNGVVTIQDIECSRILMNKNDITTIFPKIKGVDKNLKVMSENYKLEIKLYK